MARRRRPPDEVRVAFHEAGHAVACLALGRVVRSMAIQYSPVLMGEVRFHRRHAYPRGRVMSSPKLRDELEQEIMICFAGGVTERETFGDIVRRGTQADTTAIVRLLRKAADTEAECVTYGGWLHARTQALLARPRHRRAVWVLAWALLRRPVLPGPLVRRIYRWAIRTPDCVERLRSSKPRKRVEAKT